MLEEHSGEFCTGMLPPFSPRAPHPSGWSKPRSQGSPLLLAVVAPTLASGLCSL